jgi:sodium-dependent phosphate transporter
LSKPDKSAATMAALHQYDYLFAFGLIFAFLDAWNIGANDVANSFATSVSSRSLTMLQAMLIASCTEFLGAVLVGYVLPLTVSWQKLYGIDDMVLSRSRVADTIRNKIINVSVYQDDPAVLMLGMVCALVGSSLWLSFATKMGMPVSTT